MQAVGPLYYEVTYRVTEHLSRHFSLTLANAF